MRKTSIVFLLLVCIACAGPSEDELLKKGQTAQEAGNVKEAVRYYKMVVDKYPNGKYSASALFLLGSLCNNKLEDHQAAVLYFRKFAENYPDNKDAPVALFLVGYIYNNELHEADSARSAYRSFLSRYPNHEMASSAQFELDHIGQEAEEMLQSNRSRTDTKEAGSVH